MTNRNYYIPSNYATTIPSREEFHRYASNILSVNDFNTNYPTGNQSEKVARAIEWTIRNERRRNKKQNN